MRKVRYFKDILAFANAWKNTDAHVIIGVIETGRRSDQSAELQSTLMTTRFSNS